MATSSRTSDLLVAMIGLSLFAAVSSNIFSSSVKVERLVQREEAILHALKHYISQQYDRLKEVSNFYTDRVRDINLNGKAFEDLHHPNAVFRAIKRVSSDYATVLGDNLETFRRTMRPSIGSFEVDVGDIRGACMSLLRLQSVYQLSAVDMANGNYLGHLGPPLTLLDTYSVGQVAFSESRLEESHEWLNLTLNLVYGHQAAGRAPLTSGQVKALMGRVNVYAGHIHTAQSLYEEATREDPTSGDTIELGRELVTRPHAQIEEEKAYFQNFSRLCSLENKLHVAEPYHPSMVCRYREALLPYYRFKEELLSVAPFASVIYNVTTDRETEFLKSYVEDDLVRGEVGGPEDTHVSDVRTSDLGWIWDHQSEVATEISLRIKHLLGLEIQQTPPISSEAFQVVNYGLGGHYEVHMDPFEGNESVQPFLKGSGRRIATFLMYLSDVNRGGSTVFTRANIAVAPVKNMALFWYNVSPDDNIDYTTEHAGCPVLIGKKWIANKWIWTAGNTFRRRCGMTPNATQLDIEEDMKNSYQRSRHK